MRHKYILITAAKNEGAYLKATIEAVLRQTARPLVWFIVDDGSADDTAAIIGSYASSYDFIRMHNSDSSGSRNFGSKDKAIQAAYSAASSLEFDFVGVHDADIVPVRDDYYEAVLEMFAADPKTGIAGGYIYERSGDGAEWTSRPSNSLQSVAGASQMFRRACFDQIGGFKPLVLGGSDWLIQIEARMAGWSISVRPDLHVLHHRPTSTANGRYRGFYRAGQMDASFGSHPLFELLKCIRRIGNPPFLIGSLVRFSGFVSWRWSGAGIRIPAACAAYLQREQLERMNCFRAAQKASVSANRS